jgi:hypothetical protein
MVGGVEAHREWGMGNPHRHTRPPPLTCAGVKCEHTTRSSFIYRAVSHQPDHQKPSAHTHTHCIASCNTFNMLRYLLYGMLFIIQQLSHLWGQGPQQHSQHHGRHYPHRQQPVKPAQARHDSPASGACYCCGSSTRCSSNCESAALFGAAAATLVHDEGLQIPYRGKGKQTSSMTVWARAGSESCMCYLYDTACCLACDSRKGDSITPRHRMHDSMLPIT